MRRAALLLGCALLAGCSSEQEVAELTAQRQALLETTAPKGDYWPLVARKGEVLKEKRSVDAKAAPLEERIARVEAEVAQLAPALEQAQRANAETQSILERARSEAERAEREASALDAELAAIATARGSRDRP